MKKSMMNHLQFLKTLKKGKNLQILNLSKLYEQIGDWGFKSISKLTELRILNLDNCVFLRDNHIELIVSNCHYLYSLNISGCEDITDLSVKYIAHYCNYRLKELWIEILETFGKTCYKIKYLNISNHPELSPQDFGLLIENLLDLRTLIINDCGFTDEHFSYISNTCHLLEKFSGNFSQITNDGLSKIIKKNENLKSLRIRNCPNLTDEGFQIFSENKTIKLSILSCGPFISDQGFYKFFHYPNSLEKLEEITFDSCYYISDYTLRILSSISSNLRCVCLSRCPISSNGIQSLFFKEKYPKIRSINLDYCILCDQKAPILISSKCPNIASLGIAGISIKDIDLNLISKNSSQIKLINISHCYQITDHGLILFAEGEARKTIEFFRCSFCSQITTSGIKKLSENCLYLQMIDIQGIRGLDPIILWKIKKRSKNNSNIPIRFWESSLEFDITTD
ncbi:f-box and leucine-rich repeat protein [Anaeramoeba ignava]|uniref:F-box and leucine-rich repeat protein n=1 Tax=Anaeramoeba ignava TaxID=1746090 RepID=A0A9Q0LP74_ANAIG|nr:f-box and leucine-rich repeat protein [Anaeramoeba ignava]